VDGSSPLLKHCGYSELSNATGDLSTPGSVLGTMTFGDDGKPSLSFNERGKKGLHQDNYGPVEPQGTMAS
jgi:hypothetical protein